MSTEQTNNNQSSNRFRETRKWQLAYRRFVIEGVPGEKYAPYFGLNRAALREWFELQFTNQLNWENFGTAWQFEHIVPLAYFDFEIEADLYLCWNFINIRVENKAWGQEGMGEKRHGGMEAIRKEGMGAEGKRQEGMKELWLVDVLGAKEYFKASHKNTGFSVCEKMVSKIEAIEASMAAPIPALENFVLKQKDWLENIASLTKEEFLRFNAGMPVEDLLLEREILKKFG